jgi:hypothetical protein
MGEGGLRRKQDYPHETGVFLPKGSAVHGELEADQTALQGSGGARLEGLPFPRSSRWQTEDEWTLYEESTGRASRLGRASHANSEDINGLELTENAVLAAKQAAPRFAPGGHLHNEHPLRGCYDETTRAW